MKYLLLAGALTGAVLPAAAQQPDCRSVRTGTFELVTEGMPRTRITRTETRQTEQMENSSQLTDYQVNWLDDCTYELVPLASFFAKYPPAPRTAWLRVRITSVSARGYTIQATQQLLPGRTAGHRAAAAVAVCPGFVLPWARLQ